MTDKITLTNLVNLTNETTAVNAINTNNAVIVAAFDNTLSLDGTSPNQMNANFDMNSNHILNLPAPMTSTEPLRLTDANTLNGGGTITVSNLPTGGTTGQALTKNSSTNYDASWSTVTSGWLPTGGTTGQILTKNSSTNYDTSWQSTAAASSTTIDGSSTTYTSSQNNQLIIRNNNGSPMADTLPGSGSILTAGTLIKIINGDSAGILAIHPASGATLTAQTTSTGWLYVGPGQTVSIYSDGTNYYAVSQPDYCILAANTTFYCSPSGSSTNHGLTSTSPIDSITDVYNLVQSVVNVNGFNVIFQSADGTYTAPQFISGKLVGQQDTDGELQVFPVTIQGNLTTPTNCNINVTGQRFGALRIWGDASCLVQGFHLQSSGASRGGYGLYAFKSKVALQTMDFGEAEITQITATDCGKIQIIGNYTISGSSEAHWIVSDMGDISVEGIGGGTTGPTITLTGTPNFSSAFAVAQYPSVITMNKAPTFSGSATGARYEVFGNGLIQCESLGTSFFPGNSAGSTSTGGQYLS